MNNYHLDVLFLGGDKRQEHIYEILSKKINKCTKAALGVYGLDRQLIKNADIIVLPTIASLDNYTLNAPDSSEKILLNDIISISKNCRAFIAGKMPPNIKEEITKHEKKCYEYTENQPFKILNAIPTAEGAIYLAISNSDKTIWGMNCLVIGNGCIGKALSKLLHNFGANVTVAARKDVDFADIQWKGLNSAHIKNINSKLNEYDIIFNTVPFRIIDSDAMLNLPSETIIIDLASKPYGLDHTLTDNYKCKIILGSSLPGIYSPKTAAEIAAISIEQFINEVKTNE